MRHHNRTGAISVGVGVGRVWSAVGGPTSVSDPGVAIGQGAVGEGMLEVGYPAYLFYDQDRIVLLDGDAR
jgi:hypothetical protein